MFITIIVVLLLSLTYYLLPEEIQDKVSAWLKDTAKWAAICGVAVGILFAMIIFLPDALAEELPDGFYYKVVFIDEVEDQGKELLIHTDDLNHLWGYWEDNKEIDFNNDEKLNDIAKYFIEENMLWSEEETENPVIRGRIVVLIMWECCEDDPFDEEVINVYYTKYVTDVEEEDD